MFPTEKEPRIIKLRRLDGYFCAVLFLVWSLYGFYCLITNHDQNTTMLVCEAIFSPVGLLLSIYFFYTLFSKRFIYNSNYSVSEPVIKLNDEGVACHFPSKGKTDKIKWSDIALIQVLTTNEGPYVCDVFYVLTDKNDQGVVIPQDKKESKEVFEKIREFPGFDNKTFIEAMGSAQVKWFTVWKKEN